MRSVDGRFVMAALAALALIPSQARAANEDTINVTAADVEAARAATGRFQHGKPQAGVAPRENSTTLRVGGISARAAGHGHGGGEFHGRYPGDLSYNGGAVLPTMVQHAVFMNPSSSCPAPACWGDPLGFINDLNLSDFVHVTDQYVGSHHHNRYPLGGNYIGLFGPPSVPFTDNDMAGIAHAVAVFSGQSGYGHVLHIFLPQGQDVCFDSTFSTCYSPDMPASFFFCAYHSSADFSDVGHLIYTVEPFQNVGGCQVRPGNPNGTLADSTNNVLSHETIETITDPDGSAWFNTTNLDNLGAEIGDECEFVIFGSFGAAFDPSNVRLDHKPYAIQPEYSNRGHVCASRVDDDH